MCFFKKSHHEGRYPLKTVTLGGFPHIQLIVLFLDCFILIIYFQFLVQSSGKCEDKDLNLELRGYWTMALPTQLSWIDRLRFRRKQILLFKPHFQTPYQPTSNPDRDHCFKPNSQTRYQPTSNLIGDNYSELRRIESTTSRLIKNSSKQWPIGPRFKSWSWKFFRI